MSIIGTPSSISVGNNYTAEAGSDRVVVFCLATDANATGITITNFTWGGTSGTIATQNNDNSEIAALIYFKESDIPVGAAATAVTYSSGTPDTATLVPVTLAGRDQTAPLDVTSTGGISGNPSTHSLTGAAEGSDVLMAVAGATPSRVVSSATGGFSVLVSQNSGTYGTSALSSEGVTAGDQSTDLTWNASVSGSVVMASFALAATGLTIDSTDATMQRNTDFQVVCSTPSTTPTTGNTTLSVGGDTLTPSSVTGSDPYTLTFPVGDLTKQVDTTGYDWTLTVGAETATTGNIPLAIQAGYTKVDLVDPVTTNASLLFGVTGDTPVTGDDLEYDVTSTLDSGVTLGVAATGVWTITEAVSGDWVTDITVSRRVVQADGTIGTEAVMTLSAPVVPAAVLSGASASYSSATSAIATVSTDTIEGTLYGYASTNATELAATIKASGSSQTVTSGTESMVFTGLTTDTTYYAHFIQNNGQDSNVITTNSFTPQVSASGDARAIVTSMVTNIVSNTVN